MTTLAGLPGGERVERGRREAAAGVVSPDALLVAIASHRLAGVGLPVDLPEGFPADREIALYAALATSDSDPYSAYRAALAELDSFLVALEAQQRRVRSSAPRSFPPYTCHGE